MNNNKFSERGLALFDAANQYNLKSPKTATSATKIKLNTLLEDEIEKSKYLQNKLQKVQYDLKSKTAEIHNLKAEIKNLIADRDNLKAEIKVFKDAEKAALDQRSEKIKKSKQRKTVCEHGIARASR